MIDHHREYYLEEKIMAAGKPGLVISATAERTNPSFQMKTAALAVELQSGKHTTEHLGSDSANGNASNPKVGTEAPAKC